MTTIRVQNSNVNAINGHRVTMFWKEDGGFKANTVRHFYAWNTGTGNEVKANITPSRTNRKKILDALDEGRITLKSLDNIGSDHGGTTVINLGKEIPK